MNTDRQFRWMLFIGLIIIAAISLTTWTRSKQPSANKSFPLAVNPEVAVQVNASSDEIKAAQAERFPEILPPIAPLEKREESERAWKNGTYKVVPSHGALVVLENGFERKTMLHEDVRIFGCESGSKKLCLGSLKGFVIPINDELGKRYGKVTNFHETEPQSRPAKPLVPAAKKTR